MWFLAHVASALSATTCAVAVVNSRPVSCAQFVALAGTAEFHCRYGWNPPLDQRRQALDGLIDEGLLRAEAAARGFQGDDEGVGLLIDAEKRALLARPVSDAETTAWWEQHHAWLDQPAKVRVEEIRFSLVSRSQAAAMQVAELARAQIAGGEDFETVAKQLSEDGWARWGGDLGWVARDDRREGVEPMVIATAFGLVDGELAPAFVGEQAVYLVFRKTSKSAQTFDLQAHRGGIEASVRQEQAAFPRESLLARLRGAASITIDEPQLAKLALPVQSPLLAMGDYAEDPCGRWRNSALDLLEPDTWPGGEADPWPPEPPWPPPDMVRSFSSPVGEGDVERILGALRTPEVGRAEAGLWTGVTDRLVIHLEVSNGRATAVEVLEDTTGLGSRFVAAIKSTRFDPSVTGDGDIIWTLGGPADRP